LNVIKICHGGIRDSVFFNLQSEKWFTDDDLKLDILIKINFSFVKTYISIYYTYYLLVFYMRCIIVALLAAFIFTPAVLAAGQETSPNYLVKADEVMKGMIDNNFYLMPMSDLINATENEAEMANLVIIDVRPAAGYATGHIPGAINIPFTDIISEMETVPTDKKLAVVCDFDTNSAMVVAMLRVFGDRDAWVVEGGNPAWQEAGKEFVM
jgi:rhodanese-related sulfurtransferase